MPAKVPWTINVILLMLQQNNVMSLCSMYWVQKFLQVTFSIAWLHFHLHMLHLNTCNYECIKLLIEVAVTACTKQSDNLI